MEFHEQTLASTIIVLNRILRLPETSSTKKEDNIPLRLVGGLVPNIIKILKWKQQMPEVIYHALESLIIFISNESTKTDMTKLSVKANVTEDLMKLSDIYKDNHEITKMINSLIFQFAKSSEEAAFKLSDNKIVSNIIKSVNASKDEQAVNKQRYLEYLNTLADIPKTSQKIVEEGGLQYLLKFIQEENAQKSALKPKLVKQEDIDDQIYDLDLNICDAEQEEQEKAPKPIETGCIEILRKLMSNNPDFIKKHMNEKLIKEILLYLRLYADERDQAISALRIINMLIKEPKCLDVVAANKGVESIFIALNANPTDKDILELAGDILQALDA